MYLSPSMAGYHSGDAAVYEMITESLPQEEKAKHSPYFTAELKSLKLKLQKVSKGKRENLEELISIFARLTKLTLEKT